jgi:hypothetical protein
MMIGELISILQQGCSDLVEVVTVATAAGPVVDETKPEDEERWIKVKR